MDCEEVSKTIEYVLISVTLLEQILGYSGTGYPKNICQLITFIIYQFLLLFKRKKTEEIIEIKINENELIDIIIK
jgi:hypothetical protein